MFYWAVPVIVVTGSKKGRRKVNICPMRKIQDEGTPSECDPINLPLVDGFAIDRPARQLSQLGGELRATTEGGDDLGMGMHAGIVRSIFGFVKYQNCEASSDDAPKLVRHRRRMATPERKEEYVAIGKRLRMARNAVDYTSLRAFARDTGIDEDNLSNWERGVALVPPWYVQKLKTLFGITHDWVYGGDSSTLPHQMAVKILSPDPRRHEQD